VVVLGIIGIQIFFQPYQVLKVKSLAGIIHRHPSPT